MKELKIEIPEGFEIDKEKSTFTLIVFKKKSIEFDYTKIKNFSQVCHSLGYLERDVLQHFNSVSVSDKIKTIIKLEYIFKCFNQQWKPNILDKTEKKWYPYFKVSSSGLVFSSSCYGYDLADAFVGFPFCYKTKEISDHVGKYFIDIYSELLLNK